MNKEKKKKIHNVTLLKAFSIKISFVTPGALYIVHFGIPVVHF
jgi:hypothetical protein